MHITCNLFVYAQYGVGQVIQRWVRKASKPYPSCPVVSNHVGAAGIILVASLYVCMAVFAKT